MELIWLDDFLELARSGNFSRAAEARNVTQPAFSRRIRALEDWIGVTLFDRSAQPVTLTLAGREFHPRAALLMRQVAEAREHVRSAAAAEEATLRFAATHALSLIFFSGWLKAMETEGEHWTVHLSSDTLAAVETLLLDGRVQFLLCHTHADVRTRLPDVDFISAAVAEDCLVPCAAPSLIEAWDEGAAEADVFLADAAPLLAYGGGSGLGRILRGVLAARLPRLTAAPALVADLAGSLRAVCLDGRGVAWLPRSLIEADLAAGRLAAFGGEAWRVPVGVRLFRPRAELTTTAEAFWRSVLLLAHCSVP